MLRAELSARDDVIWRSTDQKRESVLCQDILIWMDLSDLVEITPERSERYESLMYIDLHEGRYGLRVQLKFRSY